MAQREHREWFRKVSKKTCTCGQKKTEVYSWGEYVRASWRTVDYVCQACFPSIVNRLKAHAGDCGCSFQLVGYRGETLPAWITMSCSHPVTE